MQYLYSILTGVSSILFSLCFLALGGACGATQTPPKLQGKEFIELGCKKDEGLMILYAEGEFLFPAQMPGGCRCFILIDEIEYVTIAGRSSAKCDKSKP